MAIPGLPVDAIERFLKKVLKSENVFKFLGNILDVADFFQKSGTVFRIFGNIPDKA